jgi:hypothetical protein
VIYYYDTPDAYGTGTFGMTYSYDDYDEYCWSEGPCAADWTRLHCFKPAGHEAEGVRCGAGGAPFAHTELAGLAPGDSENAAVARFLRRAGYLRAEIQPDHRPRRAIRIFRIPPPTRAERA